ncbi:MAG TPA: S41 family peptidase [Bacteroidales bacterium]|nr:S41 family peptidase [Bacteroidales bacterium]HPO66145.1 S41 family peptidase [Bacteroidales bacterium]
MKKHLLIVIAVVGSIITTSFVDNEFKIGKSIDIFISLFKELNYTYVDDIDPEKLINAGIDGMLKTLDPYTTYIPESKLEDFRFQTTGQYGGIGAIIRRIDDYVYIAEPYENCPAAKAGLKAGDKILAIDGVEAKGKDVSTVSEQLKGTPGTKVEVTIERSGAEQPLKINITREKITIPNVPYYGMLSDSIGYIRLSSFTTNAGNEVREAVIALKAKNARSLILDLRDNPGGLLNEAVEVVNCFIPKNQLVVFTKGKIKEAFKRYVTINDPIDTVIPLAVLTSRGTASAAEIVSGTLQDLDRAVVVGQRTFGKGLVQQTRPLSYNTQLKVTVAKYYIPSGRCIQAVDYSHRNEDGSVGYIPDSLIKEFKTRIGRTVYDGGGIMPDIKVEQEKFSQIALNLYAKNIIFNFATEYVREHPTIAPPDKFTIDEATYQKFTEYVNQQNFDYQTQTEQQLEKLVETAKKEKYYQSAEAEFTRLKERISHDKNKDLQVFRNEIEKLLVDEIITRYYYQKGRIIASLKSDREVEKAREILKNRSVYASLLSSSAVIGKGEHRSKEESNLLEEEME